MTAALNAEALLAQFAVYGRFYEKTIAGVPELLRDRLEIADRSLPLGELVAREPDLLVVMMNPGASRPLNALWDGDGQQGFVSAQPDRTQYQIMRLLCMARGHGLNWRHARILNLSDLRTPKSDVFIEKLNLYSKDDSHSLFSKTRAAECGRLFSSVHTPVLCGWGMSPHLRELAQRALQALAGHPLLGVSEDGVQYRHPLPQRQDMQLAWLDRLDAQIAAFAGN